MRKYRLRLIAIMLLGLTSSGCLVDLHRHETGSYTADLFVDWTVEGSVSARRCEIYGIDHFVARVNGPFEQRTLVRHCHADDWSSDLDFVALDPGDYQIRIDAYDFDGFRIASVVTGVNLYTFDPITDLTIDFYTEDFYLY